MHYYSTKFLCFSYSVHGMLDVEDSGTSVLKIINILVAWTKATPAFR